MLFRSIRLPVITISLIYMLKILIDFETQTPENVMWRLVICCFFIIAGLVLVTIERMSGGYGKALPRKSTTPPVGT